MAEALNGLVASFKSAATLSAYRVIARSAANEVGYWATQTSQILGVTMEDSKAAGSAIPVVLSGIAKVTCNASVTAGELVGPATGASGQVQVVDDALTTTAALLKVLGVALENGSSNSVIRVSLQIGNRLQIG
jgi:hypothetical protein